MAADGLLGDSTRVAGQEGGRLRRLRDWQVLHVASARSLSGKASPDLCQGQSGRAVDSPYGAWLLRNPLVNTACPGQSDFVYSPGESAQGSHTGFQLQCSGDLRGRPAALG